MLWGLSPHVTEDDVSVQFVSTAVQLLLCYFCFMYKHPLFCSRKFILNHDVKVKYVFVSDSFCHRPT